MVLVTVDSVNVNQNGLVIDVTVQPLHPLALHRMTALYALGMVSVNAVHVNVVQISSDHFAKLVLQWEMLSVPTMNHA